MLKDFAQLNLGISDASIDSSQWDSEYAVAPCFSSTELTNSFCVRPFKPSISLDSRASATSTRSEPVLVQTTTVNSSTAQLIATPSAAPSTSDRPATGTTTPPGNSGAIGIATPGVVNFSNLVFSGNEGATGTFQLQLNLPQAPTSSVTLTLAPGNFLVVDGDNNLANGTQNTITFTPADWNLPRTVWFIAEKDGVGTDRLTGNAIAYSLNIGGSLSTGTFDIGVVKNTYTPDTTRFNIELDFRNDTTGFWTPARQAIAQKAADDWVYRIDLGYQIVSEWTGIQLNNSISKIGNDGNYTAQTFSTKQYVDDLLVFVNTINTGGTAGGYGGPEYEIGGWLTSPDLMPRVGQIAIDPAVGDRYLYNAVSHEIGHTLGLVGLNWAGFLQQDLTTPQTAVFKGAYATAVNGGIPVPLQSQD
ncbi:MAG: hypothetical protein IGS48_17330, partial [Oscillatoriales cyanobacterium C42_A2020_001]|nr:hypothetical protein [Leptolyngbyaceae cyanobacterium C42_A2020_001]